MNSDHEEQDFPIAEFNDSVWSEEPVPDRQLLCIHLIPCSSITGHTPRPSTPIPQPVQEEVPPDREPMDVSIPDDLLDIIECSMENFTWNIYLGYGVYLKINGKYHLNLN